MDTSITQRPLAEQRQLTEAERLLAHHPSTKALAIDMTATPFSSQVAAIGYNPEHQTLRVRFVSGGEWDYHRVPQAVAEEFASTKSKGKFLGSLIKGVYHCECTREREDRKRA